MIKLDRKKRKPKKDDDEEEKERTEVDFTSDALVGTVEVRVKKKIRFINPLVPACTKMYIFALSRKT